VKASSRQTRHLLANIFAVAAVCPIAPAIAGDTRATLSVGITILESCTATTRQSTPVTCGSHSTPMTTTGDAAAPIGPLSSPAGEQSPNRIVRYLTILF
jgi:hypothetical protein